MITILDKPEQLPNGRLVKAKDEKGNPRCGAKTQSGSPCRQRPMENGRCRLHGGASPKGFASPSFKHGRFSKYLPKNLIDSYETFADDPGIISLQGEMALVLSRISELLTQLDDSGGMGWVEDIDVAWDNVRSAIGTDALPAAMQMMNRVVTAGVDVSKRHERTWSQINDQVDRRARLTLTEQRLIQAGQQYMTIQEVMLFGQRFVEVVNGWAETHADDGARRELSTKLMGVLSQSGFNRRLAG